VHGLPSLEAVLWRHIHVEGWMKKDLKRSCYGRKRDRRVEELRVCLGKREEEFWGERGHLYSAGEATSDCGYGAPNWE
jgi:hypothetical protein